MSNRSLLVLCAILLGLVGCGSSSAEGGSSTTETPTTTASSGSESPTREVGVFRVGAVGSFRDVFSPVFHADPAHRATDACEAIPELRAHAVQVHAVAAPEHVDPDAWADATTALVAGVDALGTECDAHGTNVDARLEALRVAFHRVKDLSEGRPSH